MNWSVLTLCLTSSYRAKRYLKKYLAILSNFYIQKKKRTIWEKIKQAYAILQYTVMKMNILLKDVGLHVSDFIISTIF